MLIPAAFTQIESGWLQNLDFEFTYGNDQSEGIMNFEYENLKIHTLKKKNVEKNPLQAVKTFIANTFVIKTDNLQSDKNFRQGEIQFERNKKKSIFNYWWKSLLSGFKSSTGIKEER